jgi:LPXTG-motif cell wall-anchored protein
VTATADSSHTFSDGTQVLVIEGDLAAQLSGVACATVPACIPNSSVSYTYDPLTNSGVITVPDVANSTHVLCKPFWVTATSWKYVNTAVWPQMLDVVQKSGPISTPGNYPYAAAVTCGQGDIYASDVAQPEPTATLDGPNNPFPEHFLHQMGFSGPNPTWVQQDGACATVNPKVSYKLGACYQNGTAPNLFSSSNLFLIFDNSGSTVPVTFSVPNGLDVQSAVSPTPSIVRTVAAGQIVTVETTPIWNQGGSYTVTMNGVYSITIPDATITIAPFAGCLDAKPGDPSHSNETCVGDNKVPGSITVGLEPGLIYSIDGPGTANDVSPVTTKTTTGLPAGDYVVTVVAASGYTLSGANNWPLTIKILSTVCGQLVTHPLVTPTAHMTDLSCTAAGSYTLDSNPGVLWTVNGVATNAGTYPVSATSAVQVAATPNSPNYGFDSGVTNPTLWTFAFTKPAFATCSTQLTTLAFTGVSSTLWLILAGGLIFIGIGGLLFARRRFESGI